MSDWPITFQAILDARRRMRGWIVPTPLRRYAALEAAVGGGVEILVKHENHNPTNAFKARNGLSVVTALEEQEAKRGVVAPSRGNHGQGLAWAGSLLGVPVAICVPLGNNPEKNEAMRGYGADVVEEGRDFDEAVGVAERLVKDRGMRMVHPVNEPLVIAGAGTLTLEIVEQTTGLDAMIFAVGGGSQAVGAMTVLKKLSPGTEVYGVQAERASAIHDSWHAGRPLQKDSADTFADGVATRTTYELTFGALREGLKGFVAVSEAEIAEAVRVLMRTTHNLVEGAGALGLAGLMKLRDRLRGRRVAIVLSGGNIDAETLRRVVTGEI